MELSIHIGLFILILPLAAAVSYLLILTGASFLASRTTKNDVGSFTSKFLILIPAHNEERLLPATLDSLVQLDYPRDRFEIHVVADNCTDRTAEIAVAKGAIAHVRVNETLRGKGHALQWLLSRLWDKKIAHDAVVILDADTVVSQNFLRVMNRRLIDGQQLIQAYYGVSDPDRSWSISLRYAALAVLHYLRPQGRMVLGGSCGLKGNGMVFHNDILPRHAWSDSLTEDIEFHMTQILNGQRVMFAPDAIVWAEMPETLADADSQNERWEQGRLQMARKYVPKLLRQAFSRQPVNGRFLLFDAAMEHLIPPFSILMGVSWMALLISLVTYFWSNHPLARFNLAAAAAVILGQIVYLAAGLLMARAPSGVYKALLFAPAFVIWKIILYVKILTRRSENTWIRTARNQ